MSNSDVPNKRVPAAGAIAEARKNPSGWVYEIAGNYGPDDRVPPAAIRGAWKVDDHGQIVGDFIANPNFRDGGERRS